MRRREDGWEDGRQDWGNGGGWQGGPADGAYGGDYNGYGGQGGYDGQGQGYGQGGYDGQGYGQPGEAAQPGQSGQSTSGTRWPAVGGWDQSAPDEAPPNASAGYGAAAGYDASAGYGASAGYDASAGYGADADPGYGGVAQPNGYAGRDGAAGPFAGQDRTQPMSGRPGAGDPGRGRYADNDYPPQGNFRPQPPPQPLASATQGTFGEFSPGEAAAPARSRTSRPYGRLSIFTLMDGMTAEFDRLSEEAAEGVRLSEPDTLVYVIHVVPKAPMQRIIYEIYRDRAAFESHESQPHILRFTEARKSCVLATNIIDLRLKYAKVAALFRGDEGERLDDREQWSSWDSGQSFDGSSMDGYDAGASGWSAGRAGQGAPAALSPPTRREPRALEAGARPAGSDYPGGREAADQYAGGQYDADQYAGAGQYGGGGQHGAGQYGSADQYGGWQAGGQYTDDQYADDQYNGGGQYQGQYQDQYEGQYGGGGQQDGQYGDQYAGQYTPDGRYGTPAQYGSSGQYSGSGQYNGPAGQYDDYYQGYGENGGYGGGVPPQVPQAPQAPPRQQERPPWEDEPAQYPSRRYGG